MREALVRCGRAPLSICERYDWLNPLPSSFLSAMARSCCVISRSSPRKVASTKRRYRSFSPSFILQLAIIILQSVMSRNGFGLLSSYWEDCLGSMSVLLRRGFVPEVREEKQNSGQVTEPARSEERRVGKE